MERRPSEEHFKLPNENSHTTDAVIQNHTFGGQFLPAILRRYLEEPAYGM